MIETDHVPFKPAPLRERGGELRSGWWMSRELENKTESRALRVATAGSWFRRNRRHRPVPESSQLTQNPADVTTLTRSLELHSPSSFISPAPLMSERAYEDLLHFSSWWYEIAKTVFRIMSFPTFRNLSLKQLLSYQKYCSASLIVFRYYIYTLIQRKSLLIFRQQSISILYIYIYIRKIDQFDTVQ